jgi:O-antigen biosynthesis protein
MASIRLSIFTATNDPKFLEEAYESLLVQDYDNFEWVLIPNGKMPAALPKRVVADPRVKIGPDPKTANIGGLKQHACNCCTGDAFIEFDHDDLLVPGTLSKVAEAIEGGAGFVYSDVAVFNDKDHTSWPYHPGHGWEYYPLRVYEKAFIATKCFDLTPAVLCTVHYAPDHIRVWSREAYSKTGGHNADLSVGDDHELICRTWLTGLPFKHIGCCGYLYRVHPNNTVKLRNRQIQEQQAKNKIKYMLPIIKEWCRRENLPVVELLPLVKEGTWTPGEPLPYPDHSVGQVVAFDILQYLDGDKHARFFNDVYRVLAPSGFLSIAVPHENGRYASQDPRHKVRFNRNSFLYYTNSRFAGQNPEIQCRFQMILQRDTYPSKEYEDNQMLMLRCDMMALKGQRCPGPQLI